MKYATFLFVWLFAGVSLAQVEPADVPVGHWVQRPVMRVVPPVEQPGGEIDAPALAASDGSESRLIRAPARGLAAIRPPLRPAPLPSTRWQHRRGHALWTRTALVALKTHGKPLVDMVPRDIANWCPAYAMAGDADRRAFWVGFLSTLAKHESTYRPRAVGGGGLWYGLLQILPATARGYRCKAQTGDALKNGGANLSCAVRIMARTVPRDGVIYGRGGRGVAADWGPLRSPVKRRDMSGWLKRQTYCRQLDTVRPRTRP